MTEHITIEKPIDSDAAARSPAFLPRTFEITWDLFIVIVLTVVTLFSRLWMLSARVMSHDESLHVYYS